MKRGEVEFGSLFGKRFVKFVGIDGSENPDESVWTIPLDKFSARIDVDKEDEQNHAYSFFNGKEQILVDAATYYEVDTAMFEESKPKRGRSTL